MPVTYFDGRAPFPRPGVAELDRVYRFAWYDFTKEHWGRLDAVYRKLPGRVGYHSSVPWWFGTDEGRSPHLTASVEPPGLQVTGLLPAAQFTAWHDAFMDAIGNFPAGEPA